ncbi:hypothetical protein ACM614_28055 [Streptomyces sp. 12297]|uniref:hypothetical protein n=1 Tax=Streptomyces sp. NBC_00239 TaxID=2903640 RepID=UPI002E2BB3A3|nr:hypothetical protein [Streptomyces sp. NBC_00239]
MALLLVLLIAGTTLVIIGASVDGMLYQLSIGVLVLVAALLYYLARSMWRTTHRPAH